MALPSTGPIAWGAIQSEFGGNNPIGLTEYYRGGNYVGTGDTGVTAIATSGAISADSFHGAAKAALSLSLSLGTADGYCTNPVPNGSCTATTGTQVATGHGGTLSYSYTFAYVSGDSISSHQPSSDSIYFYGTQSNGGAFTTKTATWRCTVWDGSTSVYTDFDVYLEFSTGA
jgi:hypothetical protein